MWCHEDKPIQAKGIDNISPLSSYEELQLRRYLGRTKLPELRKHSEGQKVAESDLFTSQDGVTWYVNFVPKRQLRKQPRNVFQMQNQIIQLVGHIEEGE